MKTSIILILAVIVLSACDESSTNSSDVKQITSSINGKKFSASTVLIAEEFGTHLKKLKIFGANATDSISFHLFFEPFDTIKAGTYSLSKDGYFLAIYNHSGIADTASEGTIKVDKFEAGNPIKASGTFNFVIKYNETTLYTFSNGVFSTGK